MAPEVVWKELPSGALRLRVLDPMAGSGTTLVTARMRGYTALGFDSDPLAVLLSSTWSANIDVDSAKTKADEVLWRARATAGKTYPPKADQETRDFIRYWFDTINRVQLTALATSIARVRDTGMRNLLWCAFSRMIITKKVGVSLAMDVSHSRPHKKYKIAPVRAFEFFPKAVAQVLKHAPFASGVGRKPAASVSRGDARKLPLRGGTIDAVITSPPYLNAIDYLRGHKLSLVWMGHNISELRQLRSSNVGSEVGSKNEDEKIDRVITKMCDVAKLSPRNTAMLRRYVCDTGKIMAEIHRVLRPGAKAVIVVGNCNIRGVFIENSRAVRILGRRAGLRFRRERKRPIPTNRRYLPPPTTTSSGKDFQKRMGDEVILTFTKPQTIF